MGTTSYFSENVKDEEDGEERAIEIGTSSYAGNGPQFYLKFDEASILLSHKDAKNLCEAADRIAGYLGYRK